MEEMTLKEWTIHFVKNKDLIHKNLVDYEEQGETLVFHFKNKEHKYFVLHDLDDSVISFIKQSGFKTVVCIAKKDNLKFLIDNWHSFKSVENLNLIFVRISDNKRWIINPFVHSRICDDNSLVLGLETMYSNTF